ncbi:MAG: hypothetical protein KF726_07310 [Anaerolineae bacterium]|nr:hypothetical protein [Anaerolineae bacterium]
MTRRRSRSSTSSSAYRRYRREEERRFEILTFAALLILMLILAFSNSNNGTFISYAGGGVLLGSAIIQWQRKFQVNPFTWLGAAALLALAYFWRQGPVPPLYPLLIMGAVMVVSFLTGEI